MTYLPSQTIAQNVRSSGHVPIPIPIKVQFGMLGFLTENSFELGTVLVLLTARGGHRHGVVLNNELVNSFRKAIFTKLASVCVC
jgi:hypothetical protein